MKSKHVLALVALASAVLVLGCSSDDDEYEDLCQQACLRLESCGQGVVCNGLNLEPDVCAERCRTGKSESNAQCILDKEGCDPNELGICTAGIRC